MCQMCHEQRATGAVAAFRERSRTREMSYSLTRGVWEVRWRGGDGRQRSRRFDDESAAQSFDEAIHDQKVKERRQTGWGESGGVYAYETAQGTRWWCKVGVFALGHLRAVYHHSSMAAPSQLSVSSR
jgi:hypothetical protein